MKLKLFTLLMFTVSLGGASLHRKLTAVTKNGGMVQVVRTTPTLIAISYFPIAFPTLKVTMTKSRATAFVEYHISTKSTDLLTVTPQELFQKYATQFSVVEEKK